MSINMRQMVLLPNALLNITYFLLFPIILQLLDKRAIVYIYFMATQGTVKLLSRGSGEDLFYYPIGKLLTSSAFGLWQQFPRSSPLPRDKSLTVPRVAMK